MNRIPTLKLTDEKFDEILKSNHIIENLIDYNIPPAEAQRYGRKMLKMIKSHLITNLVISENTQELINFYNNVISKDYFLTCEFENCETIPQAVGFFRKKTNKSYDLKDVINFYKYQFNESLKSYISSYENLLNKISEGNNENSSSCETLDDDNLTGLSGGTSWTKRWISGAILGLTLPTSINFSSVARLPSPRDMSGPITNQMKNNLQNIKTLNKAPTDFYIPKNVNGKKQKKSWYDRLPWWLQDIIAVGGGAIVSGFLGGRGWMETLGDYLEAPKKMSDLKNFLPRTQEHLKDARETVSDLVNGSNEKQMQSLGTDKKRQGNYFASLLTSEIFGQEEAVSDIVDYCISPFLRHLAMSANEALANNTPLGPNFLEDRVRNPLINISVLFGPAGVGKTETYKVIKDKVFMGQIPNALIQISSFASSNKSFTEWLWERKDWGDLLIGIRRDKQCMILFDEFDKLPQSKRDEICEFLRYVHDNGEIPAMGDLGPIPLNRALILLATNEVNPRQKSKEVGTSELKRQDGYVQKSWDSSFMSRVSAFIDYKQLSPCAFSEILSGELRKIRKAYWMTEKINIDLSRDFCYWAVASVSDKSMLHNGARLIKTKFNSLISTEIDRQLTKIKENVKNASTKINPERLQVELRWVGKEIFTDRLGREPRDTIKLAGSSEEYAPLLVVKEISKPDLNLNWKNLDTICNIIDDWHKWGIKQCYDSSLDPTGVNSLRDRLIYKVIDAFRRKSDPRKVIKQTVDRWIDKVSNGIFEYKLFVQILQDLHLPLSTNPLTKQLEIIEESKFLEGPNLNMFLSQERKSEEDAKDKEIINHRSQVEAKSPENEKPAKDDSEKTTSNASDEELIIQDSQEKTKSSENDITAKDDSEKNTSNISDDGIVVQDSQEKTKSSENDITAKDDSEKNTSNVSDEELVIRDLQEKTKSSETEITAKDDSNKNTSNISDDGIVVQQADGSVSFPVDDLKKKQGINGRQIYEDLNADISGKTLINEQTEKESKKDDNAKTKPKSTQKDYKSYLKWDMNKPFEENVENLAYKEKNDTSDSDNDNS